MKSTFITFFAALSLLSLVGCASQSKQSNGMDSFVYSGGPDEQTVQNAETTLAESAASVSGSLNELAEIEKALHPGAKLAPPMTGGGLSGMATVNWAGPIEPLVRKIAAAGGYRTSIIGRQPITPVLVYLHEANKPLAEILRNVNLQGGSRATIIVYPAQKIIELRYLRA